MKRATESASDDAERAATIVAALSNGHASSEEVFAAFAQLDALDPDIVRAALGVWTGPAPDPELLDQATRTAHGFPAQRLKLRTIAVVKDADVLDLGPVAEEQLRIAGKNWDGIDLAPEERLDGEMEGSFAGTLEHRVLADEDAKPLFDVLLYAGDAGVIFRAGTTELLGAIAYGTVEMPDRRARLGIQEAIAMQIIEEDDEPAPKKKSSSAPKKRAAAKKKSAAAPKKKAAAAKAPKAPKKRLTRARSGES